MNMFRLCAVPALVLGLAGLAQSQQTTASCTIEQLTDTTQAGVSFANWPDISADGRRITWTSRRDLVGQNANGGYELFLWEQGSGIRQLTDTDGIGAIQSFIDNSGTRIVFEGDADLVPGSNPDGNVEEFLWDEQQGFTQITDTTEGVLCGKSISGNGQFTFFAVQGVDLLPPQNADLNLELYRYDVAADSILQVTSSIGEDGPCSGLSNSGGDIVFFATNTDVGPPNPESNREIYRWRPGAGVDAITSSATGDSRGVKTTDDGRTAIFRSDADLVPGSNMDGNSEVFVWSADDGIRQITRTTNGNAGAIDISGDGQRIVFTHSADITGENPQQVGQLFLLEDGGISQITQLPAQSEFGATLPSLDRDGSHIAFRSRADVTGSNPDGSIEIFLARCALPPQVVPVLSATRLALLTLLVLLAGFSILSRRARRHSTW